MPARGDAPPYPPQERRPEPAALWRIRAFALALLGLCCGEADVAGRNCTVGADCVSGICLPSGQCAVVGADTGQSDGTPGFPDAATDDSPERAGDHGTDGGGEDGSTAGEDARSGKDGGGIEGCLPDNDGAISAAELPFGPNLKAMFRLSESVDPYDSKCGEPCVWDLTDVSGEKNQDVEVATLPVAGLWFAKELPEATHVAEMGDFDINFGFFSICKMVQYGVYRAASDGLYLLGVVSEKESDGTLLVYDPPVPILEYPLSKGAKWKVDTTMKGPLCNSWVDYAIDQTWESEVDAVGTVVTPYGTFENVLRVNTLAVRHGSVVPVVSYSAIRTHTYVAECFTTVAAAVGEELETYPELSAASQVRALTVYPHD